MKKKKLILIGLSLLLLVLIGFIAMELINKKNNYKLPEYKIIQDWDYTTNFDDVFINEDNISPVRLAIKNNTNCVDGAGASYYFNGEYKNSILNNRSTWKLITIAVIDVDSCLGIYKFSIKEQNGWRVKTIKKNIIDLIDNSTSFQKKVNNYFNFFDKYLENLNTEICKSSVPGRSGNAPSGVINCINEKNNEKELDNKNLKTFYYTDDFKIYTIDQNGEKVFGYNDNLKRDLNCFGNPFIQYYITEKTFKDNVENIKTSYNFDENSNNFDFLKKKSIAQKSSDKCNDENYFITKEEDNIIVAKNLYKNEQEYENALKQENENFKNYLNNINNDCNNCLLEINYTNIGTLSGPYRYSTGKSLFKESELCTSNPSTLDTGRTMHPISDEYKTSECKGKGISCIDSDNVLGVLFTADDCGEDRIKEIYGDDDYFPYGLKIKLNDTEMYIIETLKNIGFKCSDKNEKDCLEWVLDKKVKINDLIELKSFYKIDQFSMDNVYLQNIDYTDDYLEIGSNQSLYISQDLNLKFIYADYDPYSEEKCIITEEGNKISNSCGFFIEVIEKDIETNPYDTVLSLIPNPNYCNIKTSDDAITNFDWAYKITPKETAFPELSMNTDISACGDYVSFGSDYYAIHYNKNFPKRLLVVNWGGHEPTGSIEKAETGEPIKLWMSTAKFF